MQETQQCQSEKKRLVLFRGNLSTVNLFSDQLKQGFLELGYEIFDFDLSQESTSLNQLLEYVQSGSVTAMISFNNGFFGKTSPSGENICEALGIPSINILLDPPYWFHDNVLMRTPANGIIICVDRNHMNYVNRFYPNISCNGFLPHGGTSLRSTHKPICERKTDVLYAGGRSTNYILKDSSGWGFPIKQILDHLITHPEDTVEAAIEQELRQANVTLTDEELRKFISYCGPIIEPIVRAFYREKIIGSIAKAGVSLELYGDDWSVCDWVNLPNVHYSDRVSPEEILLMMENSKIVLNTMPWFRDGSHERIFNAMMCGAVAVSETSKYLEEVLPPDTWVSFNLTPESLSALPQRVTDLLANENEMQRIASTGHALAVAKHSWKARALEFHKDLLSHL